MISKDLIFIISKILIIPIILIEKVKYELFYICLDNKIIKILNYIIFFSIIIKLYNYCKLNAIF
jgi:hypothetical protein